MPRFVESPAKLWEAWNLAKTYSQRPSEIYGIHDEIAAWCYDRAVHLFGSSLEHELASAHAGSQNNFQSTTRQQNVLRRWLGVEPKFKDPIAAGKVKNAGTVEDDVPTGIVNL